MSVTEDIIFNLELNVEKALSKSRKLELIFFRALGLWNRIARLLGLPDDSPIIEVTQKVQSVIMLIRQLHTAIILLETASGPIGWAYAAVGFGAAALSATDFRMSLGD